MAAKRVHAERLGFRLGEDTRILVTGGASVNTAILQVVADVFNTRVFTMVSRLALELETKVHTKLTRRFIIMEKAPIRSTPM